jgi:sialic acid synthase SpsE
MPKVITAREAEELLRKGEAPPAGAILTREDLDVLRPAVLEGVPAHEVELVPGKRLTHDVVLGEHIGWADLS